MSVLVNFKICDNAPECGGAEVCPTGALSFDSEKGTLVIDNDKCISCGKCEKNCPIGAIRVARSTEEYEKIKKEIDEDTRTTKDLFVERYGAAVMLEHTQINFENIENIVHRNEFALVEVNSEDTIECLLKSIPVVDILKDFPDNSMYYKCLVKNDEKKSLGLNVVPSLLVYVNGNLKGRVEGYYTIVEKDELVNKIHELIK